MSSLATTARRRRRPLQLHLFILLAASAAAAAAAPFGVWFVWSDAFADKAADPAPLTRPQQLQCGAIRERDSNDKEGTAAVPVA